MRVIGALASGALLALVVAVLTGSTVAAVVVVALAGAGIVLLLRDWRAEGGSIPAEPGPAAPSSAEEFSPDISGDPDGPSSDARADHL